MKAKFKKNWWIYLIVGVLVCAMLGGIIYAIVVAVDGKVKTEKISASEFSLGGLDENGKYVETKESIYTKDAFGCYGLTVTPEFESQVKYQIYFYDSTGEFLSKTNVLEKAYTDEVPLLASHARIVITPNEEDGETVTMNVFNKSKYAKQLTIKVNKEQKSIASKLQSVGCSQFLNMQKQDLTIFGNGIISDNGNEGSVLSLVHSDENDNFWYNEFELTDYDYICVKYLASSYNNGEIVLFYKAGLTELEKYIPAEVGHFIDGEFVYVMLDTISATGSYWLHTKTSSLSCNLFEIYV